MIRIVVTGNSPTGTVNFVIDEHGSSVQVVDGVASARAHPPVRTNIVRVHYSGDAANPEAFLDFTIPTPVDLNWVPSVIERLLLSD